MITCACGCGSEGPKALGLKELGELMGVYPETIRRWVKIGGCPHHKAPGPVGRYTFEHDEAEAWRSARHGNYQPSRPGRRVAQRQRAAGSCVYFIRNESTGNLKIGHSADALGRLNTLQSANESRLFLELAIPGWGPAEEAALHAEFAGLRIDGEWFRGAGTVEVFLELMRLALKLGGVSKDPQTTLFPEVR